MEIEIENEGENTEKGGLNLSKLSSITILPSLSTPPTPSPSSTASTPALVLTNSGKRFDQSCKKKYVKQVTGRYNDTELHLAAQRGDVVAVRQILGDIDAQMTGTLSGAEFDAQVTEIRSAVVNEVNELGETALFTAADRGHLDVVKELLKYTTKESISRKNQSGFDAFHIAASQGHQASKGHTAVVLELLSKDSSMIEVPRSNGKNALHLTARQGHVDIVKALLDKDPQLAHKTDKKGQTALHMAVKMTLKGNVLWSEADNPQDLTIQVTSSSNFKLCTPKKVMSFEDAKQRAWQWKTAVEALQGSREVVKANMELWLEFVVIWVSGYV